MATQGAAISLNISEVTNNWNKAALAVSREESNVEPTFYNINEDSRKLLEKYESQTIKYKNIYSMLLAKNHIKKPFRLVHRKRSAKT